MPCTCTTAVGVRVSHYSTGHHAHATIMFTPAVTLSTRAACTVLNCLESEGGWALEGCRREEKTLFPKSFWLIYRQCSCVLCILYALLLFLLISGGLGLGGETECEHAHVTADDVAESSF